MPDDAHAAIQAAFAAWVRDPERAPAPAGVDSRRLAVYRELVFNNVESFMSNCYPVARGLLGETRWRGLLEDWLRGHRATTVSFPRLPQEFLRWLAVRGTADLPPWFAALADYEWLELEVSFDESVLETIAIDAGVDCASGVPILNPTLRLRAFDWPVHRLGPDFLPQTPEPTYLAILRTRSDAVTFMTLKPATARLVELVASGAQRTGQELVAQVARELGAEPAALAAAGAAMLDELSKGEVLLGARRISSASD